VVQIGRYLGDVADQLPIGAVLHGDDDQIQTALVEPCTFLGPLIVAGIEVGHVSERQIEQARVARAHTIAVGEPERLLGAFGIAEIGRGVRSSGDTAHGGLPPEHTSHGRNQPVMVRRYGTPVPPEANMATHRTALERMELERERDALAVRCRELERALVGLAGEDLACEVHASTCRNCGRGLAHDEACDHGGKAAVRCVLCGCDIPWAELVTGQASGPRGVILHDGEVAHARCFQGAKERA